MMMNKKNLFLVVLVFCMVLLCIPSTLSYAAIAPTDKAEIPLSDPSKPALVKVSLIMGSISVQGYNGKTVMVEATVGNDGMVSDVSVTDDDNPKAKGMIRIKNTSSGLTIVEENNEVHVKIGSINRRVAVSLKVPFKTSLKLKSVNDGFIKVENVEGDLEVSNVNGPLTLKKISGTVVANTTNGDVEVGFDKVNLSKPMAITTFNGDVTVTFPANAKFDLKMKSSRGDIYSDFKLDMQAPKPTKNAKKETGTAQASSGMDRQGD